MFGKPSLSESQLVALDTAFHVIRGCCLEVSGGNGIYRDIADLPRKACQFIKGSELGTDGDGMAIKVISLKVQYQYGKFSVSVGMERKLGGNWQTISATWLWLPSDQYLPFVRGSWYPTPVYFSCVECGYNTAPNCFQNGNCPNCGSTLVGQYRLPGDQSLFYNK